MYKLFKRSAQFSSEHIYCCLEYAAKPRLASIAALLSFLSKFYLILSFYIDLDSVALRKQLPASLNYIGITAGASQYFTILVILSVSP